MKKILITGGLGYVGGRLSRKLSSEFKVMASTRQPIVPELPLPSAETIPVRHDKLLDYASFPKDIDTVIHMAALNEIDCVSRPSDAIKVNIDETRIILENALAAGVKKFIYFSTAHIYGSPLPSFIDELTLPRPAHPYAITHKAAEDYILASGQQKKIKAIVIRLSNSFGAPTSPMINRWTLLANDLCRQAIERKSLTLMSNGCQYRDFVCLTDVEIIISRMCTNIEACSSSIYNLGSGSSMQVIQMAQLISKAYEELFGDAIPINLPKNAVPTTETPVIYSIDRIKNDGFNLLNDFEEEIRKMLIFCKNNFSTHD
jgi:UDP-glucose 4-epimerase